ncbi:hypothetical protein [Gloeobacter morelensis]|uniref:ParM/StbA family protein n=1 Tax=Gloeobacter morelensis TaxID=2907343 RepID=UPI001E52E82D|nr:hypothetical protein [Gloeobacter morelensis]UFP97151.1 hypothetical protein ISF26_23815 [Gloeobacter morelensis MG652769]
MVKEVIAGFDAGSTEVRLYDGSRMIRLPSVLSKETARARGLEAEGVLGQENPGRVEGSTLKVKRAAGGATYLLGAEAHGGTNPRALADGSKDDPDVQLFLDAALGELADGDAEIKAHVATHCPMGEWLEGHRRESIKRLLEGRRTLIVGSRQVAVDVSVLEVGPEAVPVLYFLQARRELRKGTAYKVANFGGFSLDAGYIAGNLVQASHSRHFEGGLDTARVEAVADHLVRNGLFGVSRSRIRSAIVRGSNRYVHENMQVIDFSAVLEEAEEDYARQKIADLTALWRNVPADQVVVDGGATTPLIMGKLLHQYPKATVVPEHLARLSHVMGLYHRAVSLHERAAEKHPKPGAKEASRA